MKPTVAEVKKELFKRQGEYMSHLEQFRKEYPILRDDEILAYMFLKVSDMQHMSIASPLGKS